MALVHGGPFHLDLTLFLSPEDLLSLSRFPLFSSFVLLCFCTFCLLKERSFILHILDQHKTVAYWIFYCLFSYLFCLPCSNKRKHLHFSVIFLQLFVVCCDLICSSSPLRFVVLIAVTSPYNIKIFFTWFLNVLSSPKNYLIFEIS